MYYLETRRLRLRRFAKSDVDDLLVLHNDPEVMRFLNGGRPTTRQEVERDFETRFAGDGYWVATERTSEEFLGWFAFHPTPSGALNEFELGYRLRRAAWGKGYATEGARALIRKGFTEMGLRRVWAQTMAVNTASRRVMEKAGLRYVRTVHQDFDDPLPGTELGEVEYALTRVEWLSNQNKTGRGSKGRLRRPV